MYHFKHSLDVPSNKNSPQPEIQGSHMPVFTEPLEKKLCDTLLLIFHEFIDKLDNLVAQLFSQYV